MQETLHFPKLNGNTHQTSEPQMKLHPTAICGAGVLIGYRLKRGGVPRGSAKPQAPVHKMGLPKQV